MLAKAGLSNPVRVPLSSKKNGLIAMRGLDSLGVNARAECRSIEWHADLGVRFDRPRLEGQGATDAVSFNLARTTSAFKGVWIWQNHECRR